MSEKTVSRQKEDSGLESSEETLLRYARGPFHGLALSAALECDVFSAIADTSTSYDAASLASALQLDAPALAEIVDCLCIMGLLRQEGENRTLSLTSMSRRHLLGTSPQPLVAYIRGILAPVAQWGLMHLGQRLATGAIPTDTRASRLEAHPVRNAVVSTDVSQTFARRIVEVVRRAMPTVFPLSPDSGRTIKFGDIPCGAGVYGAEIASLVPGLSVSFFDLEPVMDKAKENHERMYPATCSTFKHYPGDATKYSDPSELDSYDVILSSLTYHLWTPDNEVARQFTDLYYRLAKPGAVLIVHEFMRTNALPEEERRGLPWYLQLALPQIYVAWTVDEMTDHLRQSGWRDITVAGDVPMTGATVMTAVKGDAGS